VPHAAITRKCRMRSHDPPLRSRERRQCIKLLDVKFVQRGGVVGRKVAGADFNDINWSIARYRTEGSEKTAKYRATGVRRCSPCDRLLYLAGFFTVEVLLGLYELLLITRRAITTRRAVEHAVAIEPVA